MNTVIILGLILAVSAIATWRIKASGNTLPTIIAFCGAFAFLILLAIGSIHYCDAYNMPRRHKQLRNDIIVLKAKLTYDDTKDKWLLTDRQIVEVSDLLGRAYKFNKELGALKSRNEGIFDLFIPDYKVKLEPIKFF